MKIKSKHKGLVLILALVMLVGTMSRTAFAEEHTHGEDCYDGYGELICEETQNENIVWNRTIMRLYLTIL